MEKTGENKFDSENLKVVDLNGERMSLDQFSNKIRSIIAGIKAENVESNLEAYLTVDPSANMGMVEDVMSILRENQLPKITYSLAIMRTHKE